jgi:hypothetical protein
MNAIYIGAGIDLCPVNYLKYIKNFNYLDSQPNSEFGLLEYIDETGKNGFSRPKFIKNLDSKMNNNNFNLINVNDNLRVYSNKKQIINYYTNISIPELYKKINKNIENFDTLIVAGHDPDSIILDATKNNIHFIGFEGTCYSPDGNPPDNPNSIITRLHNEEISNRFNKYTYIYNNGTNKTFDTWKLFYNFYITT